MCEVRLEDDRKSSYKLYTPRSHLWDIFGLAWNICYCILLIGSSWPQGLTSPTDTYKEQQLTHSGWEPGRELQMLQSVSEAAFTIYSVAITHFLTKQMTLR